MRFFTWILFLISPAFFSKSERSSSLTQGISAVALDVKLTPPIEKEVIGPEDFVAFAKTLIGTPYVYGSTDPSKGFDCSGFVYYVALHFGLRTPRSSADFADFGVTVPPAQARPGDLILFTGTDASQRRIGHMGIVSSVGNNGIEFVHSSSGKGKGVIVSPLRGYYEQRFVKLVRILPAART